MKKVLDDKPENVLEYAGEFFDSAQLAALVEDYMIKQKEAAEKQKHLNDLIKGKTLIWTYAYV